MSRFCWVLLGSAPGPSRGDRYYDGGCGDAQSDGVPEGGSRLHKVPPGEAFQGGAVIFRDASSAQYILDTGS